MTPPATQGTVASNPECALPGATWTADPPVYTPGFDYSFVIPGKIGGRIIRQGDEILGNGISDMDDRRIPRDGHTVWVDIHGDYHDVLGNAVGHPSIPDNCGTPSTTTPPPTTVTPTTTAPPSASVEVAAAISSPTPSTTAPPPSTSVEVAAATPSPTPSGRNELPFTGSRSTAALIAGLSLLLVGYLALRVTRRGAGAHLRHHE
jgi:hypothetical protein